MERNRSQWVACARCGRRGSPDEVAGAGWTVDMDARRGQVRVCPPCTREYVRSIEARLDQEWW